MLPQILQLSQHLSLCQISLKLTSNSRFWQWLNSHLCLRKNVRLYSSLISVYDCGSHCVKLSIHFHSKRSIYRRGNTCIKIRGNGAVKFVVKIHINVVSTSRQTCGNGCIKFDDFEKKFAVTQTHHVQVVASSHGKRPNIL